jgi:hypothetical protein
VQITLIALFFLLLSHHLAIDSKLKPTATRNTQQIRNNGPNKFCYKAMKEEMLAGFRFRTEKSG